MHGGIPWDGSKDNSNGKSGVRRSVGQYPETLRQKVYEMDSLITKGYLYDEDFATLRDCINNGNLRGIDMSGVENLSAVPAGAFCSTKINSSENTAKGAEESPFVTKLEYVTLPSWTREISDRAFMMTNLRCITLPKLTRIGSEAFGGCANLKSVTFSQADVPYVADGHAFDNIPADATLNVPADMAEKFRAAADFSNFTTIKEDGSLFVIREFNLSETSLPLMEQLGDDLLKVDSVRITGNLPLSDVRALRLGACYGRLSGIDLSGCRIENDVLPDEAFVSHDDPPYTPSESYLFDVAHNLRYFRFPEGLKKTGSNTFMKAKLLALELPATLETVESLAFAEGELCGNLVIPEGVTSLERQAFDCNEVRGDVYLPSTLVYVDTWALGIINNGNLNSGKKVYYNRITPPVQRDMAAYYSPFASSEYSSLKLLEKTNWTLYVPVGAKGAFEADEHWGKFPNIVETAELDGGTSGIEATAVSAKEQTDNRLYTLDGRYVGNDMNRLGNGVYVVNGKKVVR